MLNVSQILLERTWEKRETPGTALAFFVGKIRSFCMWFEMLLYMWVCVCVWGGNELGGRGAYFVFPGAALYQAWVHLGLWLSPDVGISTNFCETLKQFRPRISLASQSTMVLWCWLKTLAATEDYMLFIIMYVFLISYILPNRVLQSKDSSVAI